MAWRKLKRNLARRFPSLAKAVRVLKGKASPTRLANVAKVSAVPRVDAWIIAPPTEPARHHAPILAEALRRHGLSVHLHAQTKHPSTGAGEDAPPRFVFHVGDVSTLAAHLPAAVQVVLPNPGPPSDQQLAMTRAYADYVLVAEEQRGAAATSFPRATCLSFSWPEARSGAGVELSKDSGASLAELLADAAERPNRPLAARASGTSENEPRRRLIDVYMTTSRRPEFFSRSLPALLEACSASSHEFRINVFVDRLDPRTLEVLAPHIDRVGLVTTNAQLGLPFLYNLALEHQKLTEDRTATFADYFCYIQDDCLINRPAVYFDYMVAAYEELLPAREVGYVSGFYCAIHPGFEVRDFRTKKVLLSDSIDGKNFMAPPKLLRSVGPLTWYFKDGERRGNPGPKRGSHFDLWQWKESPQSLMNQGKVSIVIPGLCTHIAQSAEDSTWGNETSESRQKQRRDEGKVYKTRGTLPPVVDNDF